jgi:hypothetical protein
LDQALSEFVRMFGLAGLYVLAAGLVLLGIGKLSGRALTWLIRKELARQEKIELATHKAKLEAIADAARFDYQRRLADFNIYATRRYDAVAAVYKEEKRLKPGWHAADRTILLLQMMDCRLDDVRCHLDEQILDEMSETGFLEIWAADYTLIEPYRTVQLNEIKPSEFRGRHEHRSKK